MREVYVFLAIMILCIVLIPVLAYFLGGWYAYLGHVLLAVVFSILAVALRTRYYWEEN